MKNNKRMKEGKKEEMKEESGKKKGDTARKVKKEKRMSSYRTERPDVVLFKLRIMPSGAHQNKFGHKAIAIRKIFERNQIYMFMVGESSFFSQTSLIHFVLLALLYTFILSPCQVKTSKFATSICYCRET